MDSAIMFVPFARVSTPSAVIVAKPREIAYYITDPNFEDFPVYKSANAWWMDKGKVQKLIDAFKQGHLIGTACFYAGISRDKWQYFNEIHPEFSSLISQIEEHPMYLRALNSVGGAMDKDPGLALSYLKATHPKFGNKKVDPAAPLQPTVKNNVVIATNVDARTITDAIRAIAQEVFTPSGGGTSTD